MSERPETVGVSAPDSVSMSTVYVIDDESDVRRSLGFFLKTVGLMPRPYLGGVDFLADAPDLTPGCVLLDERMPGMDGLQVLERLGRRIDRLPVIMMTGHGDIATAVRAMKMGAIDFIEKPFDYKRMVTLAQDCLFRDQLLRGARGNLDEKQARLALLTQREREVMHWVVAGKINRVIAEELSIGVKTVEAHRAKIMEKLEVNSVAELVQIAMQPWAKS